MLKKSLLVSLFVLNSHVFSMDSGDTSNAPVDPGTIALALSCSTETSGASAVDSDEIKTRADALENFGHADINDKLKDCFFKVVESGDFKRAEFYFENKIGDINLKNSKGQTALMLAVGNLNYDLVKLFIENKANVNEVDSNGNNVLHYIVTMVWNKDGIDGYNWTYKGKEICRSYVSDIIKILLNNGLNIDSLDKNGDSILIKAMRTEYPLWFIEIIRKFRKPKVAKPAKTTATVKRSSCLIM